MGPIFALSFVLTAVTASYFPIPSRDFFDGFRPKDVTDGRDSFFQNYWANPLIGLSHRFWNGPVPFSYEYQTRNFMGDQITIKDIFEKPIVVVTPSAIVPNTFTAFYLHDGLRSLYRFKSLSWLLEFAKTPGMKSLVFFPHYLYNVRFFETPISSVVLQDDCRMSDFSMISGSNYKVPYMFVAPESVFDEMHFENIAKVLDLQVFKDIIELLSPFSWFQSKPTMGHNQGVFGSQARPDSSSTAQSGSAAGAVSPTQNTAEGLSRSLSTHSQVPVEVSGTQSVVSDGSIDVSPARTLSNAESQSLSTTITSSDSLPSHS